MVSPIKVESGVPMVKRTARGERGKYPFAQLDVGESFFVPSMTTHQFSGNLFYWNGKGDGKSFKAAGRDDDGKPITKNGKHGVRVWRIA